jgi:hypothetical protein
MSLDGLLIAPVAKDGLAPAAAMAFLQAFGPETGTGWPVETTQND